MVSENDIIPDYTVIYGAGMRRVDNSGVEDLKLKMIRRQVDVLKKLIPSNPAKFQ
jgi:dynactin-6